MTVIEQILELARWAPSGDNSQPWRFEVVDENHFVIHGFDTREWCLYDIDGRPSQLAIGALLENISIAAPEHGMTACISRRQDASETAPTFEVRLLPCTATAPHYLARFISTRTVQRRRLSTGRLDTREKAALEASVGPGHSVQWVEGTGDRSRLAMLLFHMAKLRLTAPEAYSVHRNVIAWNCEYSQDKVPDAAVGLDPLTTRLMRWAMRDWERVQFLNRYAAGTLAPRIQMDLIPGIACAAHFLIVSRTLPNSIDDYVSAGRAMQRLWLTATQLALQVQPEMTPLIFASYVRQNRPFTNVPNIWGRAQALAHRFDQLTGPDAERAVFMARIGRGAAARARSLRLPLAKLMVS